MKTDAQPIFHAHHSRVGGLELMRTAFSFPCGVGHISTWENVRQYNKVKYKNKGLHKGRCIMHITLDFILTVHG